MSKKNNLQDILLTKLRRERRVVTLFTTNGFQMKGRITAFDQFTLVLEIKDTQQIVYKHAVSTIVPDKPVDLDDWREEEPECRS